MGGWGTYAWPLSSLVLACVSGFPVYVAAALAIENMHESEGVFVHSIVGWSFISRIAEKQKPRKEGWLTKNGVKKHIILCHSWYWVLYPACCALTQTGRIEIRADTRLN